MKKVFFLIVAFAFVGTAAIAQLEQKDHKKNQEEWNNKVKEELKLTSDQVVKYDALSKEYSENVNYFTRCLTKQRRPKRKKDVIEEREGSKAF